MFIITIYQIDRHKLPLSMAVKNRVFMAHAQKGINFLSELGVKWTVE